MPLAHAKPRDWLATLLISCASATPALAGSWHEDGAAGVRVRLPFPPGLVKTGRQVEALIRELEPEAIADGITYTSGVYAEGGFPYFVIWKRADSAPPTRGQLRTLASDPDAARGWGLAQLSFDPVRMLGRGVGLAGRALAKAPPQRQAIERRVLFQLARGETIFLGYYATRPEHAAFFEELAASFELAPSKRLDPSRLPGGGFRFEHGNVAYAAGGCVALLGAIFVTAMYVSTRLARRAGFRSGK